MEYFDAARFFREGAEKCARGGRVPRPFSNLLLTEGLRRIEIISAAACARIHPVFGAVIFPDATFRWRSADRVRVVLPS